MQPAVSTYAELTQPYTTAIEALWEIGRAYYTFGRLGDALHLLRTSLQLIEANEVLPQDRLKLLLLYAKVLIVDHLLARTDPDLMFSTLGQAKRIAETAHDQQGLADALSLLGQAHYFATLMASLKSGASPDSPQDQGKYAEALTYQQQALALREGLHDTRGVSESHFQIGSIYERWQQYDQAQEHYTKARQVADDYGHLFEKVEPARHVALLALIKGDLDQALTYALQALSYREAAQFKPFLPLDHLLLRDIYLAKGDPVQALFHTQQASALAEEMGHPTLVASLPSLRDMQVGHQEEARREPR